MENYLKETSKVFIIERLKSLKDLDYELVFANGEGFIRLKRIPDTYIDITKDSGDTYIEKYHGYYYTDCTYDMIEKYTTEPSAFTQKELDIIHEIINDAYWFDQEITEEDLK